MNAHTIKHSQICFVCRKAMVDGSNINGNYCDWPGYVIGLSLLAGGVPLIGVMGTLSSIRIHYDAAAFCMKRILL